MTSDNYDYAYDMFCDLLYENKGLGRIEAFERVISEFRLTDSEKAKLFELVLQGYSIKGDFE